MDSNIIALLTEYFQKAKAAAGSDELAKVQQSYESLLPEDLGSGELNDLRRLMDETAREIVILRGQISESSSRSRVLSDEEKQELLRVMDVLDNNLFTYHFQPIVLADNGEIFGYEALMRAEGLNPLQILRYSELTGRLSEIEERTYQNVLAIVTGEEDKFCGRRVFLNSMPDVRMHPETEAEIMSILTKVSDRVVIEMTENTQFSSGRLESVKNKFRSHGIDIAVDDFGTGYSNISNLLRYTPNYVKIDRSLMSGIENDQKKRHFVREIIEFCHDNGIKALAEGVETHEELRTVIMLGIDLIQGYYTARPSADIIKSIPYALRAEIKELHQEREDGKALKIYFAANGERVSLEKVSKGGYSKIFIGKGFEQGNVIIAGAAHLDTGIHLETAEGFSGRITLDNAHLSNQVERPCIDIGDGGKVSLILVGDTKLENSGIRVPEHSQLMLEGKGNLDISLGSGDYYGIGNDINSANGELIFDQDGTVSIAAHSHSGTCIGSGLGGSISIHRGRYVLRASGGISVALGSFTGPVKLEIIGCDLEAIASGAMSTAIGSMYGDVEASLLYSSIKCSADGQLAVGIGTVHGNSLLARVESVNMGINVKADALTAIGCLAKSSEIHIARSSARLISVGTNALTFGGLDGGTKLELTDMDLYAELSTSQTVCTVADAKDVHVSGGRCLVMMGETELDSLVY